jgi:NADH-quinone oxidoreductase subunit C
MEFAKIVEDFKVKYPEQIQSKSEFGCDYILAEQSIFKDVIRSLKEDYDFEYLVDVVAVHWPKSKFEFEMTYNLFSIKNKVRLFVKVAIEKPVIETITDIYKGANFMEREEYDLMGITFEGHPDLRRVLLPDFFEGHPLRKDYDLKDRKWFNKVDEQGVGIHFDKV